MTFKPPISAAMIGLVFASPVLDFDASFNLAASDGP